VFFKALSTSSWLSISPQEATTPYYPLQVSTCATGLSPNVYNQEVAIQDRVNSPNSDADAIKVTLTVGPSPELILDRDLLQVCYVRNSTPPGPFSIEVQSTGSSVGKELSYTRSVTAGSKWLSATNGTTPSPSLIAIDTTYLDSRVDYEDSIQFTANGAGNSAYLSVHLTIAEPNVGCPTQSFISSIPHIAAGGGFVTDLYVVNLGDSPANFSISFYTDTGDPMSLPVSTLGLVNNVSGMVTGHGPTVYELGTVTSPLLAGSARITADAGITVQTLFRRLGSDNSYYEAAVPMSAGATDFWLPFDTTTFAGNGNPIFTGLAIANLDSVNSATVTCTVQDAAGKQYPNVVIPISRRGHWSHYSGDSKSFPLPSPQVGTLDCTSNTVVGSVGLRFLGYNALSSLPIITSGGSSGGTSVLPQIAAGGGFITDLYVVNSGDSPANFSISFYTDTGDPMSLPVSTLGLVNNVMKRPSQ
jgi:hypothetical protein